MLVCAVLQIGWLPLYDDGAKPPWNQPQVSPLLLSRSPMFSPVISPVTPPAVPGPLGAALPLEHSSKYGSTSPSMVPLAMADVVPPSATAPWVLPLMTFSAPGVDG